MEAAYSDDPDPEEKAYAAGVAVGAIAPTTSSTAPSAMSATSPTMVEIVDVDKDDDDDVSVEVVEGNEEVQLARKTAIKEEEKRNKSFTDSARRATTYRSKKKNI